MIRLDVEYYCDACRFFEPELKDGFDYAYTDERYGDIIVVCQHATMCKELSKRIEDEYDYDYDDNAYYEVEDDED